MDLLHRSLNRLIEIDRKWIVRCNEWSRFATITQLLRITSRLGNGVFWYVLMALLLVLDGAHAWQGVLHMTLAGLTGTLVYSVLKKRTLRPRPYELLKNVRCMTPPLDAFSFPSGHTLHAVVFTSVALAYFPLLWPLLLPFTLLVAISRPVLGLHYPSDVLAGAVLGAGIAGLSFQII